ncbi:MAG TPA: nicotinate (nicotinamide) nucleotide adenylyltransferase [Solirubrobacteraceae bacterium]|jgi:nicotinate-nucleotide adenylyltransferase|nr:nicotinate (nicotinamide) nucleotide adenylyltransferase [Solirubrobacteraceae bacterium]
MSRLGILGGSFNPPHLGHLACAEQARRELGLERVALMPVGMPPHKPAGEDPGREHRLTMAELAVAGHDGLCVSSRELRRPGPSYTVDTLREIHASDPGAELTFIVGGDMASTLPQWREPRAILELARIAVAGRDGLAPEQVRAALAPLDGNDRLVFLHMPPLDVSSSQVRERVAADESIAELVPGAVADYIHEHGLYR